MRCKDCFWKRRPLQDACKGLFDRDGDFLLVGDGGFLFPRPQVFKFKDAFAFGLCTVLEGKRARRSADILLFLVTLVGGVDEFEYGGDLVALDLPPGEARRGIAVEVNREHFVEREDDGVHFIRIEARVRGTPREQQGKQRGKEGESFHFRVGFSFEKGER